jgi:hypothetical protein
MIYIVHNEETPAYEPDSQLAGQFARDFDALATSGPAVTLELDALQAWIVMAMLQLACRHPDNTGNSRVIAEAIGRTLQTAVATTPALNAIAERGWRPPIDVQILPG